MLIRKGLAAISILSTLAVASAGAADLGGYYAPEDTYNNDHSIDQRSFADTGFLRSQIRRNSRARNWSRYDGPQRPGEFFRLRDDLEDAGYSRIAYHDVRTDRFGESLYYLTVCQDGVRYRMHVTADCEIELKRRAGYCRSAIY